MNLQSPAPDGFGFEIRIVALLSGLQMFLADLLISRYKTLPVRHNSRIC